MASPAVAALGRYNTPQDGAATGTARRGPSPVTSQDALDGSIGGQVVRLCDRLM